MKTHFTADFFAGNRKRLRQALQSDAPIFISANGLLERSNDTTFPFRQDSDFWYLTGITEPDLILCMTADNEFLLVPERSATRAYFDGAIDLTALSARSGIQAIYTGKEGWLQTKQATKSEAYVKLAKATYDTSHGMYHNPANQRVLQLLRRQLPGCSFRDISPSLAELRVVKQAPELAALESAISITQQSLNDIRPAATLHTFANEYEIESAITDGFRRRGAAGHGYTPIVAGGKRATTLHYVSNDSPLKPGELIVLDVGAEVELYSADITRTITQTRPSARQLAVHNAVLEVQSHAISLLKPGADFRAYEQAVHKKMGEVLHGLKLITSANDHEQIWRYYPHATSHFLGLDVHDVGDYREPLRENMVVTCEPGIYIADEGIGIRLEDDIVITPQGSRVLGDVCSYDLYTV